MAVKKVVSKPKAKVIAKPKPKATPKTAPKKPVTKDKKLAGKAVVTKKADVVVETHDQEGNAIMSDGRKKKVRELVLRGFL